MSSPSAAIADQHRRSCRRHLVSAWRMQSHYSGTSRGNISGTSVDPDLDWKLISVPQIGAGIQVPPNAARVVQYFGLEQKLRDAGAIEVNANHLKRYQNGKILCSRTRGNRMIREFKGPWL
jgi:hypothetical protein